MTFERRSNPAPVSHRGDTFDGSISLRGVKDLVLAKFPEDHPLREVMWAEKDRLTPAEFLAKLEIWLVLLSRRA